MNGFDIGLDLFPLLAGTLAAVCCGVLGNFLVLRRLSLMGDAISHSVLPGLVIAFLLTTTRNPLVMLVGAAVAGALTVVLVEVVKRLGRVEPGAAMGVVFSLLFAVGVLLIERAAVRHVDLDADCVLHGQLETLVWYGAPDELAGLFRWTTFEHIPRQVYILAGMVVLAFTFVFALFKELRIAAFDPGLATSQGFHAGFMHYLLMLFVAFATVASFEAVGSILVIAMLVCPAATARLLTDKLGVQIVWSVIVSVVCGVGGYVGATAIPAIWGVDAVNAAGAISVFAGVLLAIAIVASPRHGIIVRWFRRRRLARRVAVDDLIGALYRIMEHGPGSVELNRLKELLGSQTASVAVTGALQRGLIEKRESEILLTASGLDAGAEIVRKHRLWERFLVEEAGFAADHVHATAEQLEHVETEPPREEGIDPHGRRIP